MRQYKWLFPCTLCGAAALAVSQWFVYHYAPVESRMGVIQKIFYTHLPLAWWAFMSFFIVCLSGIFYLVRRDRFWDALAGAAAETGMVLCTLTVVTGSIWARYSWNTWWTWDPRLTTALVLWFLYAGYLVLRHMDLAGERRSTLCAVVGIVAFADVPLVFLSARLWRSIHPAVFASEGGGLEPEMLTTVLISLVSFGIFWAALLGMRLQQIRMAEQMDTIAFR